MSDHSTWIYNEYKGWQSPEEKPICWHQDPGGKSAFEVKWLLISSYLKCRLCGEEKETK